MPLKVLQINLQHSKAASAAFCRYLLKEDVDVALIQEPWIFKGRVAGLGECKGRLIYCDKENSSRTCIFVRSDIQCLPLLEFCSRDITTVKLDRHTKEENKGLVLSSDYLPHDGGNPPTRELEQLVEHCTRRGEQTILGCDTNSGAARIPIQEVSTCWTSCLLINFIY